MSIGNSSVGKAFGFDKRKPLLSPRKFVIAYNKALVNNKNEPKYMKKTTFSPSKVGGYEGKCPRYWYHAFDGGMFESDFKPTNVRAMDSGTDAHERIQAALQDLSWVRDIELEFKMSDPPMRGFIDLVFESNGKVIVGDIKTVGTAKFRGISSLGEPDPAHVVQVLLYMWATDAEEGFLLYEDRDTFKIKMVAVYRNDEYVEEILEWLRKVRAAWEEQSMPKRCYEQESYVCKKCPVRKMCWGADNGTLEIGCAPIRD